MNYILVFLGGSIVGTFIGVVIMCCCAVAKEADTEKIEQEGEIHK